MRLRMTTIALVAVATLALAACGGGGDGDGGDDGGTTAATGTTASTGTTGGTDTDDGPITITAPVGAANTGFAETQLDAAADTAFTIHFVNEDDGIPHNVQIFEGTDTSVAPVFAPEGNALVTGPDETDYEVPALAAGAYTFNCLSHPTTMVGTLTVA